MSRPKPEEVQAHLTIRVPVSMRDRLTYLAYVNKVTVSEYIRKVLKTYMKDTDNGRETDV